MGIIGLLIYLMRQWIYYHSYHIVLMTIFPCVTIIGLEGSIYLNQNWSLPSIQKTLPVPLRPIILRTRTLNLRDLFPHFLEDEFPWATHLTPKQSKEDFKVGDVIKCIDSDHTYKANINLTMGNFYRIISSSPSPPWPFVWVTNDNGEITGYHACRFKNVISIVQHYPR